MSKATLAGYWIGVWISGIKALSRMSWNAHAFRPSRRRLALKASTCLYCLNPNFTSKQALREIGALLTTTENLRDGLTHYRQSLKQSATADYCCAWHQVFTNHHCVKKSTVTRLNAWLGQGLFLLQTVLLIKPQKQSVRSNWVAHTGKSLLSQCQLLSLSKTCPSNDGDTRLDLFSSFRRWLAHHLDKTISIGCSSELASNYSYCRQWRHSIETGSKVLCSLVYVRTLLEKIAWRIEPRDPRLNRQCNVISPFKRLQMVGINGAACQWTCLAMGLPINKPVCEWTCLSTQRLSNRRR